MSTTEICILPSLDGDPGVTMANSHLRKLAPERWRSVSEDRAHEQYEAAVLELLAIFDRHGLRGKVTWFLNEADVRWTDRFEPVVREMVSRGDEIGLHTHFGGLFGGPVPATVDEAYRMCAAPKQRLEQFAKTRCTAHRAGCFYQSALTYLAVRQAGLRIVSDVNPSRQTTDAEGRLLDNAAVPFGAAPWHHDDGNWTDYRSTEGWFLHVPVHSELVGGLGRLADRLRSHTPPAVCWDIHPHEIQNLDGTLSVTKTRTLERGLRKLHRTCAGDAMTFRDYTGTDAGGLRSWARPQGDALGPVDGGDTR